jgi:hypothetical protein
LEKTKESKERRFKILKKINNNSYDNKLTSVPDLEESLKLNTNEIFPETKHLEDLDCLDRTIRGEGNPMWNITGKAKSSMEKNPKNYDEFLQYFEGKPQSPDNTTMISPSNKNLLLGFQLTKKTLGYVGVCVVGIAGIIALLFLISSFPNIQVYLYETDDTIVLDDNVWGTQNIRIAMEEKDGKFNDWSKICFRVQNTGQDIGSVQVPANNMKIHVSTDAICKDCTEDQNVGLLKSQFKQDICEDFQTSEGTENFNFEITTQYDAIWNNSPVKHVYNCNFVEKIEHDLANTRDYAYSCSLEK